jgi:transcriptional regulator with XRE-family HTH domain
VRPYTSEPLIVSAPELATRLGAAMEAREVSLRGLATVSGVDKMTIQRWRQGHRGGVEVAAVRKVAEALGTSAEDLLDLPGKSDRPDKAPEPPDELDRLRELAADLDPRTLAAFEQTLPTIREAVEVLRGH